MRNPIRAVPLLGAVLAALFALSGCGGAKKPPAAPTDAPPPSAQLADEPAPAPTPVVEAAIDVDAIAERLREIHGHALTSLRVTAKAAVDAEETEGRKTFSASLIAQLPGKLRFRASREPIGELFQLLQDGDHLSILLARDRLLFEGPIDTLTEHAGIIKKLRPLWMLRGLVAGGQLARTAKTLAWSRLDARTLRADGASGFPELPFARYVVNEESLDPLRVFLYGLERGEPGEPGKLEVAIVYEGWTTVDGARLPLSATVSLPGERARIVLSSPDYLVNPTLPAASLEMRPPAGVERYELWQLAFQDPEDDEAEATE